MPELERAISDVMREQIARVGSIKKETSLEERVGTLEKRVHELEKQSYVTYQSSKTDLVYAEFRKDLEKEHLGKIVAIDTESGKILGIGDSVLEAYQDAIKKTDRKQFSYRRVGYKFVHKL